MCTREMERVVSGLQERDRLAHVLECDRFAALRVCEPRDRPVEANAHVRVAGVADATERVTNDFFGFGDLAHVGEGIAQERRVARFE